MSPTSAPNRPLQPILLVVASSIEARAVLQALGDTPAPNPWKPVSPAPGLELVVSGIGKANAAAAVGRFADPSRQGLVLNIGIAGTLAATPLGEVLVADRCIFADEGVQAPDSFSDCASMGFPLGDFPGSAVPVSAAAVAWLETLLETLAARKAPIATVSTCSGSDALAAQVRARTGAAAEAMEGAAAALAAHRLGIPFAEVRVVSNTTGDRPGQVWDMKLALSRLTAVIGLLAQSLRR